MLRELRTTYILQKLREKKMVTVSELTRELNASRATVYRDLEEMERQGQLRCVRGGAVPLTDPVALEPPFRDRQTHFVSEKQRIARRALELIPEHATLMLDAGTTVFELAKLLVQRSHLHVATNDLNSAMALSANPELYTVVLGGVVRSAHCSMNGIFTEDQIRQIHADITFLSVDAIHNGTEMMCFSMEEIPAKRLMIQNTGKTVVLCDHSKFETVAFASIGPVSSADLLITDSGADPDVLRRLEEQGVGVIVAQ